MRACRREPVDATPVWFMRQAGRSFAAYRRLRERHGILELAKDAGAVRRGHAACPSASWASTRPSCSPTSCCRSSRWASDSGSSPTSGRSSTRRSARPPTSRGCGRSIRPEVLVHARRDPAGQRPSWRHGSRHRLLGRAVHARLLPHRGAAVARLRDREGVHVPRARRVARPDAAPVGDGRRAICAPRSRPAPTSSSSSTAGSAVSARRTTRVRPAARPPDLRRARRTCRPSISAPARRAPGADGRCRRGRDRRRPPRARSATPGGASGTTAASRATSTPRACSPAGSDRAGRRGRARRGGRTAGPHLQPRPRRAARDRHGAAASAGRLRPRADRHARSSPRPCHECVDQTPGVLLMTYGSPASLDREDVAAYLARVRGGREPDPRAGRRSSRGAIGSSAARR